MLLLVMSIIRFAETHKFSFCSISADSFILNFYSYFLLVLGQVQLIRIRRASKALYLIGLELAGLEPHVGNH